MIDETIGYPVAVKAAGGGGGKGFRVALTEDELEDAFEGAAREGEKFFGDADGLPRALPAGSPPRRGPGAGRQARQRDPPGRARLLDPAPPPEADRGGAGARRSTTSCARGSARSPPTPRAAVNYTGAGTVEGLLQDGEYFFLEMNTRVQVEHCVTEMVTGVDIVKEGIRVAAGEPLSIAQDEVELRGHAIECRINAEDASKNFAPAPGRSRPTASLRGPACASIPESRAGSEISPMYDPMVAKLIVWDADREQATARMLRALSEYEIERPEDAAAVPPGDPRDRAVGRRGETCRDLIEDREWLKSLALPKPPEPAADDAEEATVEQTYTVEVSGKRFDVKVIGPPYGGGAAANGAGPSPGAATAARKAPRRERAATGSSGGGGGDTLASPLQGTVLKVAVEQGAAVEEGALVCVIEAMKMENEIIAHKAGKVVGAPDRGGRVGRERRHARGHRRRLTRLTPPARTPTGGCATPGSAQAGGTGARSGGPDAGRWAAATSSC